MTQANKNVKQSVKERAMQLYREISEKEGVVALSKQLELDPPHDNTKFFQGYKYRIDFIKQMTDQVKQQLSEDDDKSEKSQPALSDDKRGSDIDLNPNIKAQIMAKTQQTTNNQLISHEEFNRMREKVQSSA